MTDPITVTAIAAIAASKFLETAASKAGETVTPAVLKRAGAQVDALWQRIKRHFAGNPRAEAAIAQVETAQSEAALTKLAVYLEDDLAAPEHQGLAQELQQLAQQIINIGHQTQQQNTFNIEAKDSAKVTAIGEVQGTTINFN
ncbi:hypothetical protein [Leptolyngbya sp. PCC 6406]|uniref:hypothetical protein n=1 Tax=Leptolyngbya sp. PCC 6406 TaxID=1173264 RepID=UPI0002ACCE50|nr:hypothetical protein [Leptolyngbya sp. PCC 6406]